MATIITPEEKEKLYTQVFHLLGMPVRGIELTQEQMDTFLELSISEYEQYVSDWLIESQWSSLIGLNLDRESKQCLEALNRVVQLQLQLF